MTVNRVGVVGAGVMGRGLAQSLAQYRLPVTLLDVSDAILESARAEIRRNLRLAKMLDPQSLTEPIDTVLGRIDFTTDYAPFAEVDFVVENVVEKWEVKREVYPQLDAVCPAHTVYAANTSAISITRIAGVTKRAEQVLGMHFMNPVPMKPMVEVIRGFHTSEQTIQIARDLLAAMGKECVVVQDMPGFVSNRVLMLTINEAVFLVQDQVATAAEVDQIFRSCFGHKMGPLETADLIGLDTILLSIEVLYESYNDSKYRPCPLLKKMVDAGLYGRKSGRGFYTY
ncbi:MAG TPA: 3-hydroxyacyl-CoA dehydrogenase NAD-binding domain-containing protein [Roseiflexaceae bacterium]|nr:3-hydroxyacyl-CoA dehydrogenase NAD-binding domain-containing protein [Roseiflexaceae bacterium]